MEKRKLTEHKEKRAAAARARGEVASERVLGSGPPNRHGMPQMPPGQRAVEKWPVLDLGEKPDVPREAWRLTVTGAVAHPVTLDWDAFMALPQVTVESDFHCVTTWSKLDMQWGGVLLAALLERVQPTPSAQFVFFTAYDNYTTNLSLEDCLQPDVMLVHTWNGAPLPREHGGPVRVVTPRKYAWKGAKWVREILFLEKEELGFWELRGYSNTAEPWRNDRYSNPVVGG